MPTLRRRTRCSTPAPLLAAFVSLTACRQGPPQGHSTPIQGPVPQQLQTPRIRQDQLRPQHAPQQPQVEPRRPDSRPDGRHTQPPHQPGR